MPMTAFMEDQFKALAKNLAWNWTWLADPSENGVIFKYEPEEPIVDKAGNPTGKTYGKLTTTIIYGDGTTCTCSNSPLDRVGSKLVSEFNGVKLPAPVLTADDDSKMAGIVANIFKRMIGSIKEDCSIDGSGSTKWLKNQIEKNSYDQNVMASYDKASKKQKAAENQLKHDAEAKKARERKVKRLAKQLAAEKEAEDLLAAKKSCGQRPLCETKTAPRSKTASTFRKPKMPASTDFIKQQEDGVYVRPAKRFADFTPEEKRAYWRAQKQGML